MATKKKYPKPRIGGHVSAAGGVQNAPLNAQTGGYEAFQFFSRPPQGGKAPALTKEIIRAFRSLTEKYSLPAYIHAPYFINLASKDSRVRYGSLSVLRQELERGASLGVNVMMTHIGSARDFGQEKSIRKVIEGVNEIMKGYRGATQFCLELSAGSGNILGDTFEELAAILEHVDDRVGICFDTCHAFASGYDLRDAAAVAQTLAAFDSVIGLDRLAVAHLNDSMFDLQGHRDRHAHIGKGKIGSDGIKAILHHPRIKKIDVILETPFEGRADDLRVSKALRKA